MGARQCEEEHVKPSRAVYAHYVPLMTYLPVVFLCKKIGSKIQNDFDFGKN